jgi:hypothetical protein
MLPFDRPPITPSSTTRQPRDLASLESNSATEFFPADAGVWARAKHATAKLVFRNGFFITHQQRTGNLPVKGILRPNLFREPKRL